MSESVKEHQLEAHLASQEAEIARLTKNNNLLGQSWQVAKLRAEAAEASLASLSEALKVECTCRAIEKCERCEAIDALPSPPGDQP